MKLLSDSKGLRRFLSNKENIGLIVGPLLFVATILIPLPDSMAKAALNKSVPAFSPQLALGTMLWMVVWWVTECVPLGITGMLAPVIFTISGILTVQDALERFADPIIWIFIAGFVLAASFQRWGLDKRIAYSLAILYRGSNPKIAIFFVACLPVFLLTMTGSITASTTIVFPFLIAFMSILNIPLPSSTTAPGDNATASAVVTNKVRSSKKRSNYAEASFLSLGQAASAGAMLLLISTAPNLIAKATVEEFVPQKTISFVDWFVIGTPHAIIGLFISWVVIFLIIKPEIKTLPATRNQFKTSLKSMGKIQREEKAVLAILITAMFLWIGPSLLRSSGSILGQDVFSNIANAFATNVTEAIPALMIIMAIATVKTGRNRPPLLKWDEMMRAVDWNIVILFGGGLALGLGMEASGLADWIGSQISLIISGTEASSSIVFAVSAAMAFVISYAASNTASAVITCPIAATLAIGAGVNPIPPIIAAGLACSISSAIPSTTPPMAIVYSSRAVRISNMFKTGMTSDLIRLGLLILVGPLLIGLLF
ncbi:MAG: DASS family sodium-coupled anion symporter [Thermoproteota archaeon]|nr:DASS family sodium-coupled anion symporter [Thermoproteota archaeon]